MPVRERLTPPRLRLGWLVLILPLLSLRAEAQLSFADVTTAAGLAGYIGQAGDGHAPGAVFTDLTGDGLPDLYLVRAFGNPNHLYLNIPSGFGRAFLRAPASMGADLSGASNGAIAADYDNDGDQDLYVIRFSEPNVLLQNQLSETGSLSFVDVTAATNPGGADQHGVGIAYHDSVALDDSLTAAWGDVDRDGDLDLYVGNHNGFYSPGAPNHEGPFPVPGRRDVFYLNNGDGTFTEATMALGLTGWESATGAQQTTLQRFSSTNAVIFADFNNDRWPDLLVTNKVGGPDDRDHLYLNLGAGPGGGWLGFLNFTYLMTPTFGHRSGGAMGVDVADLDHDGDLDIYITDWSPEDSVSPGANDLWWNQLTETGGISFVHSSELPAKFSWGTVLQDLDNDGWDDVHVATQAGFSDFLYRNLGAAGWDDVSPAAGIDQTTNARSSVVADYNADGAPDIFVANWNLAPALFENQTPAGGHLHLRLRGDPGGPGPLQSTRDAIGARVVLLADLDNANGFEADEAQIKEVAAGSSNAASTNSLELEFGLGAAPGALFFVLWPSGRSSLFLSPPDLRLEIREETPCGDLTLDDAINASDVALLRSALANPTGSPLSAAQRARCDVHGVAGSCDIGDVASLLRHQTIPGSPPGLWVSCEAAVSGF